MLVTLTLLCSCTTPENITYFQDIASGTVISPSKPLEIKVKPEDKLSIQVSTQDPALSAMFNLVTSQNRLGQTTSTTRTSGNSSSGSGQVAYYNVNSRGDITFPILGRLHIAGMTREQVAEFIEKKLRDSEMVKDPIVTVEFANTGLSIIGEVASPGRYEFNKDRVNVLDALAMAGDLTVNGMRENVMVIRETEDGKQKAYRIDLTDMGSLANSPVYYLQQNDVIYVESNDKKKRETTPNGNTLYTPSFWVSMGSFAVTLATFIITLSR